MQTGERWPSAYVPESTSDGDGSGGNKTSERPTTQVVEAYKIEDHLTKEV